MNSRPPFPISRGATNMRSFECLLSGEQIVWLLLRVASLFPWGETFDPYKLPVYIADRHKTIGLAINPKGLACGFPEKELVRANDYLLKYPWCGMEIGRAHV